MKQLGRLSWGIVIYAIMYLCANGLATYGITGGLIPVLCKLVVLVAITTIAGRALTFRSWKDILPYSIAWMFIVIGIDALFTLPLAGPQMYGSPVIWIGYALVALLPLAAPQTRAFEVETSDE